MRVLLPILALVRVSCSFAISSADLEGSLLPRLQPRSSCNNTPSSRQCWGQYDIDTNYYSETPNTKHTVEIWLSAEDSICNQDGYKRPCMTFNGTVPGPAITANWGDNLIIHVTNRLKTNGTTIHWHGVRQQNNVEHDGVPGVTQCPIAPGETFTYKFNVTQYGTTWYHSHYSLQYGEGLYGALIVKGPATANYDEDLGPLFLSDWSHTPIFTSWIAKERYGVTQSLTTTLINGTNTFNCSRVSDPECIGNGKKFQTVFQPGKKYLIRLIHVATDSQFQFSIDGHKLQVIASDFVPIQPYDTDSVTLSSGQRYDIIVEANATPGDYWLRGGWVAPSACQGAANDSPNDMTGIVRYDAGSTKIPTSNSTVVAPTSCHDEPLASLVPHLKLNVTNIAGTTVEMLRVQLNREAVLQWTINSSSLVLDWTNPTLQQIFNKGSLFPTSYNVVSVDKKTAAGNEWAVLVIENTAAGAFGFLSHPIHLHGHDFWILAQETNAVWDGTTASFNMNNTTRRDTAILPAEGYLAIAFQLDNPGVWLIHCHIAWHASQGLSLEFVESQKSISVSEQGKKAFGDTCSAWEKWVPGKDLSSDSGI